MNLTNCVIGISNIDCWIECTSNPPVVTSTLVDSIIVHYTMALLASAVVYRLNLEYTPGLIAGLVLQNIFSLAFFEIAKRSRLDQVLFGIKLPVRSPTTETASIWWSRLSAAHSVHRSTRPRTQADVSTTRCFVSQSVSAMLVAFN